MRHNIRNKSNRERRVFDLFGIQRTDKNSESTSSCTSQESNIYSIFSNSIHEQFTPYQNNAVTLLKLQSRETRLVNRKHRYSNSDQNNQRRHKCTNSVPANQVYLDLINLRTNICTPHKEILFSEDSGYTSSSRKLDNRSSDSLPNPISYDARKLYFSAIEQSHRDPYVHYKHRSPSVVPSLCNKTFAKNSKIHLNRFHVSKNSNILKEGRTLQNYGLRSNKCNLRHTIVFPVYNSSEQYLTNREIKTSPGSMIYNRESKSPVESIYNREIDSQYLHFNTPEKSTIDKILGLNILSRKTDVLYNDRYLSGKYSNSKNILKNKKHGHANLKCDYFMQDFNYNNLVRISTSIDKTLSYRSVNRLNSSFKRLKSNNDGRSNVLGIIKKQAYSNHHKNLTHDNKPTPSFEYRELSVSFNFPSRRVTPPCGIDSSLQKDCESNVYKSHNQLLSKFNKKNRSFHRNKSCILNRCSSICIGIYKSTSLCAKTNRDILSSILHWSTNNYIYSTKARSKSCENQIISRINSLFSYSSKPMKSQHIPRYQRQSLSNEYQVDKVLLPTSYLYDSNKNKHLKNKNISYISSDINKRNTNPIIKRQNILNHGGTLIDSYSWKNINFTCGINTSNEEYNSNQNIFNYTRDTLHVSSDRRKSEDFIVFAGELSDVESEEVNESNMDNIDTTSSIVSNLQPYSASYFQKKSSLNLESMNSFNFQALPEHDENRNQLLSTRMNSIGPVIKHPSQLPSSMKSNINDSKYIEYLNSVDTPVKSYQSNNKQEFSSTTPLLCKNSVTSQMFNIKPGRLQKGSFSSHKLNFPFNLPDHTSSCSSNTHSRKTSIKESLSKRNGNKDSFLSTDVVNHKNLFSLRKAYLTNYKQNDKAHKNEDRCFLSESRVRDNSQCSLQSEISKQLRCSSYERIAMPKCKYILPKQVPQAEDIVGNYSCQWFNNEVVNNLSDVTEDKDSIENIDSLARSLFNTQSIRPSIFETLLRTISSLRTEFILCFRNSSEFSKVVLFSDINMDKQVYQCQQGYSACLSLQILTFISELLALIIIILLIGFGLSEVLSHSIYLFSHVIDLGSSRLNVLISEDTLSIIIIPLIIQFLIFNSCPTVFRKPCPLKYAEYVVISDILGSSNNIEDYNINNFRNLSTPLRLRTSKVYKTKNLIWFELDHYKFIYNNSCDAYELANLCPNCLIESSYQKKEPTAEGSVEVIINMVNNLYHSLITPWNIVTYTPLYINLFTPYYLVAEIYLIIFFSFGIFKYLKKHNILDNQYIAKSELCNFHRNSKSTKNSTNDSQVVDRNALNIDSNENSKVSCTIDLESQLINLEHNENNTKTHNDNNISISKDISSFEPEDSSVQNDGLTYKPISSITGELNQDETQNTSTAPLYTRPSLKESNFLDVNNETKSKDNVQDGLIINIPSDFVEQLILRPVKIFLEHYGFCFLAFVYFFVAYYIAHIGFKIKNSHDDKKLGYLLFLPFYYMVHLMSEINLKLHLKPYIINFNKSTNSSILQVSKLNMMIFDKNSFHLEEELVLRGVNTLSQPNFNTDYNRYSSGGEFSSFSKFRPLVGNEYNPAEAVEATANTSKPFIYGRDHLDTSPYLEIKLDSKLSNEIEEQHSVPLDSNQRGYKKSKPPIGMPYSYDRGLEQNSIINFLSYSKEVIPENFISESEISVEPEYNQYSFGKPQNSKDSKSLTLDTNLDSSIDLIGICPNICGPTNNFMKQNLRRNKCSETDGDTSTSHKIIHPTNLNSEFVSELNPPKINNEQMKSNMSDFVNGHLSSFSKNMNSLLTGHRNYTKTINNMRSSDTSTIIRNTLLASPEFARNSLVNSPDRHTSSVSNGCQILDIDYNFYNSEEDMEIIIGLLSTIKNLQHTNSSPIHDAIKEFITSFLETRMQKEKVVPNIELLRIFSNITSINYRASLVNIWYPYDSNLLVETPSLEINNMNSNFDNSKSKTTIQRQAIYIRGPPRYILPLCKDVSESVTEILWKYNIFDYVTIAIARCWIDHTSWTSEVFLSLPSNIIESLDFSLLGFIHFEYKTSQYSFEINQKLQQLNIARMLVTSGSTISAAAAVARSGICQHLPNSDIVIGEIDANSSSGKTTISFVDCSTGEKIKLRSLIIRIQKWIIENIPEADRSHLKVWNLIRKTSIHEARSFLGSYLVKSNNSSSVMKSPVKNFDTKNNIGLSKKKEYTSCNDIYHECNFLEKLNVQHYGTVQSCKNHTKGNSNLENLSNTLTLTTEKVKGFIDSLNFYNTDVTSVNKKLNNQLDSNLNIKEIHDSEDKQSVINQPVLKSFPFNKNPVISETYKSHNDDAMNLLNFHCEADKEIKSDIYQPFNKDSKEKNFNLFKQDQKSNICNSINSLQTYNSQNSEKQNITKNSTLQNFSMSSVEKSFDFGFCYDYKGIPNINSNIFNKSLEEKDNISFNKDTMSYSETNSKYIDSQSQNRSSEIGQPRPFMLNNVIENYPINEVTEESYSIIKDKKSDFLNEIKNNIYDWNSQTPTVGLLQNPQILSSSNNATVTRKSIIKNIENETCIGHDINEKRFSSLITPGKNISVSVDNNEFKHKKYYKEQELNIFKINPKNILAPLRSWLPEENCSFSSTQSTESCFMLKQNEHKLNQDYRLNANLSNCKNTSNYENPNTVDFLIKDSQKVLDLSINETNKIPFLFLSGNAFNYLKTNAPNSLNTLIPFIFGFGSMNDRHKISLVEYFQNSPYYKLNIGYVGTDPKDEAILSTVFFGFNISNTAHETNADITLARENFFLLSDILIIYLTAKRTLIRLLSSLWTISFFLFLVLSYTITKLDIVISINDIIIVYLSLIFLLTLTPCIGFNWNLYSEPDTWNWIFFISLVDILSCITLLATADYLISNEVLETIKLNISNSKVKFKYCLVYVLSFWVGGVLSITMALGRSTFFIQNIGSFCYGSCLLGISIGILYYL